MATFILFLTTLLWAVVPVLNQCCTRFAASRCVECPRGMHLHRANCIFDIPNCVQYLDGFECATCVGGFKVAPDRLTCMPQDAQKVQIPAAGFELVELGSQQEAQLQQLAVLAGNLLGRAKEDMNLFRAFGAAAGGEQFYRIIFYNNQGFLEAVFRQGDPLQQSQLLHSKIFEKQPDQQFINIDSDPQIPQARLFIAENYKQLANAELIDSFRSQDKPNNQSIYRVFMLQSNLGLNQVLVKLNTTFSNTSEPDVQAQVPNLTPEVKALVNKVITNEGISRYLRNSFISRVEQLPMQSDTLYNITFIHPDTTLANSTQYAQSFLTFMASPGMQFVLNLYLYKKDNPDLRVKIIANTPTNQLITSVVYEAYINVAKIQRQPIYDYIRDVLMVSYAGTIMNSTLVFSARGENETNIMYQLAYEKQATQHVFIFCLAKDTLELRLIRSFAIAPNNRTIVYLGDSNRTRIMQEVPPIVAGLSGSFVTFQPMFDLKSRLVQISTSEYSDTDPDTRTLVALTAYHLKYQHNPTSPHQFTQFRYEITPASSVRILGIVLYPFQKWTKVPLQNLQLRAIITEYVTGLWATRGEGKWGELRELYESVERSGVYKGEWQGSGRQGVYVVEVAAGVVRRLLREDVSVEAGPEGNNTNGNGTTNNSTGNTNNGNSTNGSTSNNTNNSTNTTTNSSTNNTNPKHTTPSTLPLNLTLSRLVQFLHLQFQPQLQSLEFAYLIRVPIDSYLPDILKVSDEKTIGDVYEVVFWSQGAAAGAVVGVGGGGGQVAVVRGVAQRKWEDVKAVMEGQGEAASGAGSGGSTPPVVVQNMSEVKSQATKQHPKLVSMYEALTGGSLLENTHTRVSYTTDNLTVVDLQGRTYVFDYRLPIPTFSIATRDETKLKNPIGQSQIKATIQRVLNMPQNKINDLKITSRRSLLGYLDTYEVQFITDDGKDTASLSQAKISTAALTTPLTSPILTQALTSSPKVHRLTFQIPTTIAPALQQPPHQQTTIEKTSNITQIPLTVPLTSSRPLTSIQPSESSRPLTSSMPLTSSLTAQLTQTLATAPQPKSTSILSDFIELENAMLPINPILNPATSPTNITHVSLNESILPVLYSKLSWPDEDWLQLLQAATVATQQAAELVNNTLGPAYKPVAQRTNPTKQVTLINAEHTLLGSVNIVGDLKLSQVYTVGFVESGWGQGAPGSKDGSLEQIEKYVSEWVTSLTGKMETILLSTSQFSLKSAEIVYRQARKLGILQQLQLYYNVGIITLKIAVLAVTQDYKLSITITQIQKYNSNLPALQQTAQKYRQQQIGAYTAKPEFKAAEAYLMQYYGHYITGGRIVDIVQDSNNELTTFDVTYQTSFGRIETRLAHNTRDSTTRIVYLVVPRPRAPSLADLGCRVMSQWGAGCQQCLGAYYLHSDGNCYPRMTNCEVNHGAICLKCSRGYFVSGDRLKCA